jgi:biotin operon repressor
MIWQTLVSDLAKTPPPPPPPPKVENTTVTEMLNKIVALLGNAPGKALTTNQIAEALDISKVTLLKRMASLRQRGAVTAATRGPSDSTIWKLK